MKRARCFCWLGFLLASLAACRERRALGPEDLILNATSELPTLVTFVIDGRVICPPCADDATMLIAAIDADGGKDTPFLTTPYTHVGAFQATLKVLPETRLLIRATVFSAGGILTGEQALAVPADPANGQAVVRVELPVP
ncbi:MAG: hypothetical protein HY543_09610, partial [Deltaproteobacteria bacterium]|nr:hypothetical protein [Deltaproteobacteria bacterium]